MKKTLLGMTAAITLVLVFSVVVFAGGNVDPQGISIIPEGPRDPVETDSPTPFTLPMKTGEVATLEAVITPEDAADNAEINWQIRKEDRDLVDVEQSSAVTVTALQEGEAIIRAQVEGNNDIEDSITIQITDVATPPTAGGAVSMLHAAGALLVLAGTTSVVAYKTKRNG